MVVDWYVLLIMRMDMLLNTCESGGVYTPFCYVRGRS